MTVRRDIAALEAEGRVVSVQGGVRLTERAGVEPPRERASRAMLELPRKQAIAAAAVDLVSDDSVVFLDAGTTCEALVPFLARRQEITVVTNDFFAIATLRGYPSIQTISPGASWMPPAAPPPGRWPLRRSPRSPWMSPSSALEHGIALTA